MTNTDQMRKAMDLVEATNEASKKPVEKNVKVNLETLLRDRRFTVGRYNFNRGFLTFQDILDQPKSFIEKYRKESGKDTSNLVNALSGFKPEDKLTDKEKYLRQGWEARGYSNGQGLLVWYKDNKESLIIFARGSDALQELRDFFVFFGVIRTS